MFDDFKRYDEIDGRIFYRNSRARCLCPIEVAASIMFLGIGDGICGEVDRNYRCRAESEFGRSITSSTTGIEHATIASQTGSEGVSCEVFVPQVRIDKIRHNPFAGEFSAH